MEQEIELRFPSVLTVQGQTFGFLTNTTARQDTALDECLERHGLKDLAPLKDEASDEFCDRVFARVLRTDAWADLLSCRLAFPGQKWNREQADKIRELLLDMDDPEEKKQAMSCLPWLVLGFFANGLVCISVSQLYSSEQGEPESPLPTPEGNGYWIPLEPGGQSSGGLLAQIRSVWNRFWTARFGKSSRVSRNELETKPSSSSATNTFAS